MQKTDIPNKFQVAWANGDTSRVEVPVTSSDATRASQTLGFPPLTMQPPEAGGVPPNGEDFNGGLNQIARVARWLMTGNGFPYDAAFATATPIGGYAQGAIIPRADGTGYWVSTADNNITNPDATDGTAANWLPAWVTGAASISVSSTDVTVYPVTAAKQTLLLSGTLTANRTITLPAWIYPWQIVDNTVRGGFTLTVKTVSGTGVLLQTGAQCVRGDGTNIVQLPQAIAPATISAQAATLGQALSVHGQANIVSSGSWVVPANVNTIYVTAIGGGGGGGGTGAATGSGGFASSGGGGGGDAGALVYKRPVAVTPGQTLTITIGGSGAAGVAGTTGSPPSAGGSGGMTSVTGSGVSVTAVGGAGGANSTIASGANVATTGGIGGGSGGSGGSWGIAVASYGYCFGGDGGAGAPTIFGGGGGAPGGASANTAGKNGVGAGAGGSGGAGAIAGAGASQNGNAGGSGAAGAVLIEY